MASDCEVLREILDENIPVCFQADSEEVLGLQQPGDFYLMIPRDVVRYFPLVTDKVKKKKHFANIHTKWIPGQWDVYILWYNFSEVVLSLEWNFVWFTQWKWFSTVIGTNSPLY